MHHRPVGVFSGRRRHCRGQGSGLRGLGRRGGRRGRRGGLSRHLRGSRDSGRCGLHGRKRGLDGLAHVP